MAVFVSKKRKRKYDLSRLPHGDQTVGPYTIYPYPSVLEAQLDLHLKELLNGSPKCIDGQNGNVLDNLIDNWGERVKNGLHKQHAIHLERIRHLVAYRDANLQNAWDWLDSDEKELQKLMNELDELEQEDKKFHMEMPKW